MTVSAPPRDWVSKLAGIGVALSLAGGLAYLFAGPAARVMGAPWREVWVDIVRPAPPAPARIKLRDTP